MIIRVEIDDRIRAVGSVLLLTDLIKMNDYWKHPEVKALTLKHIAPLRDHPCAALARAIDPTKSMGSAFHCYAVFLKMAGDRFVPATDLTAPLAYRAPFEEFERAHFAELLTGFYRAAGLKSLWEGTSGLWEEVVGDCREMLAEEDPGDFLRLLYGNIDVELIVVPSPLNPTSFSYGPHAGSTAYAIVGPPNVPRNSSAPVRYLRFRREFQSLIFHEFSHTLLRFVEDSVPDVAERVSSCCASMPTNQKFRDIYGSDPDRMWFDELFIRAATALYEKEMGRGGQASAYLKRQEDEYGLGWLRLLCDALGSYLEARRAGEYAGLAQFLPELETVLDI